MTFNIFEWFKKETQTESAPTAAELFKHNAPIADLEGNGCNIGMNNTDKINLSSECEWIKTIEYNKNKRSILIADDNPGIISFMVDDLEALDEDDKFQLSNYNLLKFDGVNAAYEFEATQHAYNGFNIDYAILDLTLGGTLMTPDGPVKYTGVDIYQQILIYNPDVKVLFYTGNNLNEYIKSNQKIIEQFKTLTNGKEIKDFVLFKTSLDLYGRREFLSKWFS